MKNNNKTIIRKLSQRGFLANKSRNIFTLSAIVLTTVLITAVFTIGINLSDSMKQMLIQNSGRSTEVDFQYLTEDEAQRISQHPLIKEYGLSKMISLTSEGVFRQVPCEIKTADSNFLKFSFFEPTTGRMPESENEIILSSSVLDMMNLPRELGQIVYLDFKVDETPYSLDFVVSGYWDSDHDLRDRYNEVYISEELADKLLEGVDPAQTRMGGGYYGVTKLTANIDDKISRLEENVTKILEDTNVDVNIAGILYNTAYTSTTADGGIIIAMTLLIALIFISGYLLIYNIFYISVMRDVKFYGLLKTVGTTQKQLVRIVNFQALILCVVGIPLGLTLGYLMGVVLIPFILGIINIEYITTEPNIWIFLLGALTSLITVVISCRGPAKMAGKVSPIEAVRYTNVSTSSFKKIKKGNSGAKIPRMAWSNIFRSRKKVGLVISSLSIGLILFHVVFTYVNSYDVNKFLQSHINGDFLISNTDYFNIIKHYTPSHVIDDDLISRLEKLKGVQEVAKVYYENGYAPIEGPLLENIDKLRREQIKNENSSLSEDEIEKIIRENDSVTIYNGFIDAQVYGFDNYWFDKLEENLIEGTFDREKFMSGDYLLLGSDSGGMIKIGDTVTLSFGNKESEQYTYKVMGKLNNSALNSLSAHFTIFPGLSVYIPSSEFEKLARADIMSATIMSDEPYIDSLQTEIGELLSDYPDVDFRSRADYIAEMEDENQQFALIGFTLCAVILLIGILNFVNTTMTNIFSRKQEFARLQSIGMTGKQIKKMIVLEGLYHMFVTLLIFVTIGYNSSHFIISTLTRDSLAYTYKFSLIPLTITFPILMILACILPTVVYNSISKDSVVSRLRESE